MGESTDKRQTVPWYCDGYEFGENDSIQQTVDKLNTNAFGLMNRI